MVLNANIGELLSLRIVATVATHGTYSSVKLINATADTGVNTLAKAAGKAAMLPDEYRIAIVDMMFSLAMNPDTREINACHVPNPNGMNIHEIY